MLFSELFPGGKTSLLRTCVPCGLLLIAFSSPGGPFPKGSPPAKELQVVDVSRASQTMRLSLTVLQGLANRERHPSVYLLHPGSGDAFWLEQFKSKGYLRASKEVSIEQFIKDHSRDYDKVFVFDPELSGSINAACMLGSVERGVPCHPKDLEAFQGNHTVVDLRGKWRNNAEAIEWARTNLLHKLNTGLLASINPHAGEISQYDYLVRHKVFTFWITGQEKEKAPGSNFKAERDAVDQVLRGYPPNTPVLGFWYSGIDPGINEYTGVGFGGERGHYTVVSSLCGNTTVLSGLKADIPGAVNRYQARLKQRVAPRLERDKVYVCFEFTESGDSPFYLQSVQWREWQDPARGELAFNWNIGPIILDLAPAIMEYFFDNATPNDFFCMAPSGAGYNHPYRKLFSEVKDKEAAWKDYIQLTRSYMQRLGIRDLQLYTDAWVPFDRQKQDPVTSRFVDGIPELRSLGLGMGRDGELTGDTGNYHLGKSPVLVSHCLTRWDPKYAEKSKEENITWLVKDVQDHAPTNRPGFMHAMVLSWAYDPTEYVEIVRRLGTNFVPVTIPEYVRLFGEARDRKP